MPIPTILSYVAAYFSLILAATVVLRDKQAVVQRLFTAGMLLFAVEEVMRGISYGAVLPADVIYWHKRILAVSTLIPAIWLGFSLAYPGTHLRGPFSKWVLFMVGAAPVALVVVFRKALFTGQAALVDAARWLIPLGWFGRSLQVVFLVVSVLILFNLERTIRASTGRLRWQIKFTVLAVVCLFAVRIYISSQYLLFSTFDTGFGPMSAVALIAANVLFAMSLARGRSMNANVYLSTATIQNSFAIILAGIYLLSVGLLARFARYFVPGGSLPVGAFVVFLSLIGLAVLLLSDRLRRQLRLFVTRHFRRPTYDYRSIWMKLTQGTTSLMDINELSGAVSRMVSESLEILSVSVWLLDESKQRLTLTGSTAIPTANAKELEKAGKSAGDLVRSLQERAGYVDVDNHEFAWPREVMSAAPDFFRSSRIRYVVGLQAAGEFVGLMTLNDDRVGKENLCAEDFVLLETLASQLAASILNVKLSARLRHAKEIETFQTVSTFFVHDLKNLASRLSLTMQNLPRNFESPEFRADALQVISKSLTRIDEMCSRLAMLKGKIELKLADGDLNRLVTATLDEFKGSLRADIETDLQPMPEALIDSDQIHKVLTNLVMNANEAVNGNGVIRVATTHEANTVGLSVRDNGCGMSEEFIKNSLFRPFQTTKKKGLGIGLFHSKLIVEAHRGRLEVNSTVGKGTEFRVVLPIH